MADPAILLLAAGASSRMRGRDKLMEEVDGVPLLRRQIGIARATGLDLLVALPPAPHPRYGQVDGASVLGVEDAARGMDASLAAGLSALGSRPAVLVLLADMPEIETEDLEAVLAERAAHPDALVWRAATEDGEPGHPVLIDRSLFGRFADLPGDSGGRAVIRSAGDRVRLVRRPGRRARLDLDTPEAWAAWRVSRGEA